MGGPVYDKIKRVMADYPFFQQHLAGQLPFDQYLATLQALETELRQKLGASAYAKMETIPACSEYTTTQRVLDDLKTAKALASSSYDSAEFKRFRHCMQTCYDHQEYNTFIFPEEGRIAYAISQLFSPKTLFAAGSYYGYWVAWTMPGLAKSKGRAILSDIDPSVSRLSQKNIENLGYAPYAKAICDDAEKLLRQLNSSLDMLMLDAYGRSDDPREQYRGKSIYGPLVQAGIDKLRSGGIILCHNIDKRSQELDLFFTVINASCSTQIIADTTDGVAVYVKD